MAKSKKQLQVEKLLQSTTELTKIVDTIPAHSIIHKFNKDVQREVITRLVGGETPHFVSEAMTKAGHPMTWQHVSRVQKRILPLIMEHDMPNAFFYDPAVESQIKKLEFLISEQYARVVSKLNTEDETKDILKMISTVKDPYLQRQLSDMLPKYYRGELSEEERKYVLAFTEPRGYDASLTKDIRELALMHKEYLALRAFLGDRSVTLKDPVKELEEKLAGQVLDEKTTKQVSENMRKAALNVINMIQKDDKVYEVEKPDEKKEDGET